MEQTSKSSASQSYLDVFRCAPDGAQMMFPEEDSWCTSMASKAGRKIRTGVALTVIKNQAVPVTVVTFLGNKPAKPTNTRDTRQQSLPLAP